MVKSLQPHRHGPKAAICFVRKKDVRAVVERELPQRQTLRSQWGCTEPIRIACGSLRCEDPDFEGFLEQDVEAQRRYSEEHPVPIVGGLGKARNRYRFG
jgi:hypothetical protein